MKRRSIGLLVGLARKLGVEPEDLRQYIVQNDIMPSLTKQEAGARYQETKRKVTADVIALGERMRDDKPGVWSCHDPQRGVW